jgi:hypothetical protein
VAALAEHAEHAEQQAGADQFAGAVLVARHGAHPRARQPLRVLELRLPAPRRTHRESERPVVLRRCPLQHLPPRRHDIHRLAPRIRGRARPGDRIHEAHPSQRCRGSE